MGTIINNSVRYHSSQDIGSTSYSASKQKNHPDQIRVVIIHIFDCHEVRFARQTLHDYLKIVHSIMPLHDAQGIFLYAAPKQNERWRLRGLCGRSKYSFHREYSTCSAACKYFHAQQNKTLPFVLIVSVRKSHPRNLTSAFSKN